MTQTMKYDRKDDGTLVIQLFNVVEDGDNALVKDVTYNCLELPESIQTKALVYGVSKLCAERTSETSPSEDKLEGIDEVFESLLAGNWERERKKGGGPTVRVEVEALASLRGITVKQCQTVLKKYDKDAQEQIFSSDAVQEKVAEMAEASEGAADDVSFDDLVGAATE